MNNINYKLSIENLKKSQDKEIYVVDDFLIIAKDLKGQMKVSTNLSQDDLMLLLMNGINGLTNNGLLSPIDN